MPSGPDTKAEDYFHARTELLHTVSRDGGRSWQSLQNIDYGYRYLGGEAPAVELSSGRIVVPLPHLASHRSTGFFACGAIFSNDGGNTWTVARNELVVDSGGKSLESGADEPVAAELPDGRIWMVIRTQTGYLFESYSSDGGETWTAPQRTIFRASNAPPGVLRLKDGRLLLVWNNEIGEPFEQGLSYSRQSLVMAIHDGRDWRGYREIAPPFGPDDIKGAARYPYLIEAGDGTVLVGYTEAGRASRSALEGDGWRDFRLVRILPEWLLESRAEEDFSQGTNHLQLAGTAGAQVTAGPAGKPVLRLEKTRADKPSGMTWNFPFRTKGSMRIQLRADPGFLGVYFGLAEYCVSPSNRQGGTFRWMIGPDGRFRAQYANDGPYLATGSGRWDVGDVVSKFEAGRSHELCISWNCDANVAQLRLDDRYVATLVGLEPARGMNYLRLFLAATLIDQRGVWVSDIRTSPELS
jgi:hypothetical protein